MTRRNLLQPKEYQAERRDLASASKVAFADPPTRSNQVLQWDFSEFETTAGGVWRIAGCADYVSKYEFGWHPATTCNAGDAIATVGLAIAEAERLAGGIPLVQQLTDPATRKIHRIKLVTGHGGAFKGSRFAACIASRPELLHIRTRCHSPGHNGVRERACGSLNYEHLDRLEITDGQALAVEAEHYRQIFNHLRPHEVLGMRRPIEIL